MEDVEFEQGVQDALDSLPAELREREGDPPLPGDEVEEDGIRMTVTKVAPSPLPGDRRRCVYVQGS